jgi:prevent-host-death family protein
MDKRMQEVGLFEAKNKLSALVTRAEKGEDIVITRHGQPTVRLVPVQPVFDREKARRAVEGLLKSRKGVTLGGLKIKDLINEGRP